jgi:putative transposase
VKHASIARYRAEFPVRLMCRMLEVSPSGFYASLSRGASARSRRDDYLRVRLRALHQETKQRYGSPKLYRELKSQGIGCGHNRVARLMREDGLRSKRATHFKVTTQSEHEFPLRENILERRFALESNQEINRVWAADITYVYTMQGYLYLAVVLDLASRRVVGWALSHIMDRTLVLSALQMALTHRRPERGLLHHSDRGSQYASSEYQRFLAKHHSISSMSRKGNCWDNAVAESFFATLKTELVHGARWATRQEAKRAIAEFIEIWYNRKRRHESLGYRSPMQYEEEVLNLVKAA